MKNKKKQLRDILSEANKTYRLTGTDSGFTDEEYDFLLEQLNDSTFNEQVGIEIEKNKIKLPSPMGSMNKIKTQEEIAAWIKSKDIPEDTKIIITPKYDGLSLLTVYENGEFKMAATRGDGITGQDITEHLRYTRIGQNIIPNHFTGILIGEAIMSEELFKNKYSTEYKNPRNMVAGMLGRKQISPQLQDISFIAYAVKNHPFTSKQEEISFCNKMNNWMFNYKLHSTLIPVSQINHQFMDNLRKKETEYQIDGLIIEINDKAYQQQLGFETHSLNPAFARAWKPESDQSKNSKVVNVNWQVSKSGYLKPVVEIEPVELGGVTISNITGINAKFIEENTIGKGALISFIRSGDVIPKITKVLLASNELPLPMVCTSCNSILNWNNNHVELVCPNLDCEERKISANIEFFKILEIEEVGEGIVKHLYQSNYKSIKDILALTVEDFLVLDSFKEKKAQKVYDSIHSKLKNVPLYKLQHASNLFKGLGSLKLKLLEQFNSPEKKPSLEDIAGIEGYSDITSNAYLNGFDDFWKWLAELPITTAQYTPPIKGIYTGKIFVFTGFRDKELEKQVTSQGGKIGSSVSKKTTALVMKAKGSGSSKEKKAMDSNIPVYTVEEFKDFLKNS